MRKLGSTENEGRAYLVGGIIIVVVVLGALGGITAWTWGD
jgi:hypothetical protein